MPKGRNQKGYGLLTNMDVDLVEKSLEKVHEEFKDETLKILEIGVFKGRTSEGIFKFLNNMHPLYEYWIIDKSPKIKNKPAFKHCNIIVGDSAEVFMHIPNDLHWVLVDGCHCVNHVILDFIHYGDKLLDKGLLLFHDTCRKKQAKNKIMSEIDYKGHGPKNCHEFGTAVLTAFEKLNIYNLPNWKLLDMCEDERFDWGGTMLFQKVSAG